VAFVIEDGVSVAKQVKTGIQSESNIEIASGLGEDEDVVTGSYRAISKDLQNGTMVKIGDGKKE
jgi:HlyD family secretion protein